jgi:integrating conjugative element protein (TIGR03758 family)
VNAAQSAAFQAGSGIPPGTLLNAIAAIVLTLVFVWVIWVSLGTLRAWQDGQVDVFDLVWGALRASIVLLVLGFYLR